MMMGVLLMVDGDSSGRVKGECTKQLCPNGGPKDLWVTEGMSVKSPRAVVVVGGIPFQSSAGRLSARELLASARGGSSLPRQVELG